MSVTATELAAIRADFLIVAPGLAAPLLSSDTAVQAAAEAWFSGMADEKEPQLDRGRYGGQWTRAMTYAIAHEAAVEHDGANEKGETTYSRRLAAMSTALGKPRRSASPSFGSVL